MTAAVVVHTLNMALGTLLDVPTECIGPAVCYEVGRSVHIFGLTLSPREGKPMTSKNVL